VEAAAASIRGALKQEKDRLDAETARSRTVSPRSSTLL
jgi:hypothetical protein